MTHPAKRLRQWLCFHRWRVIIDDQQYILTAEKIFWVGCICCGKQIKQSKVKWQ